jgi:hypothetical protein
MAKRGTDRRKFLSAGARAAGVSVAFGLGLLGDIKLNSKDGIKIAKGTKVDIGVADALAVCGVGLGCGGGGGQCGMGLGCGGGGGVCGMGLGCSGE